MTTYTLTALQARLDVLIQASDDELTSASRSVLLEAATEKYNRDRPRTSTADLTGAGRYYALTGSGALLTGWVQYASRVVSVEYPAATIASGELPLYLDNDAYQLYEAGGVQYLLLLDVSPTSGDKIRITYTVPAVFASNSVTLPAQDFNAFCYLAAALCCQTIATKYSRTNDSTINADSVNHPTRADLFAARYREYLKLYAQLLGIDGGDNTQVARGAAEFLDMDSVPGWPAGRQYLYHGDR